MAVELKFSKTKPSTPWGFRLVGGREFDQPLVVVKVNDDSIAESAGLEEGDVVVRINDISTAGMTHAEAHDLLMSAGLNLVLGVRKGAIDVHDLINVEDEEYEATFADLVKSISESVQNDLIIEATQRISEERNHHEMLHNNLNENLSGQEQILYTEINQDESIFNKSLIHGIKKDKQWSTFLVKPEKPVPEWKRTIEQKTTQDDAYRVVIKKQPRKRFAAPEKKVKFDQNVVEVQLIDEPSEDTYSPETLSSDPIDINDNELEENEELHVENCNEDNEAETEENEKTEEENIEQDLDCEIKNNSFDLLYKPLSEIKVDEEGSMTLEEQLRAVQKQLQALSQLPSAVQLTLDAVSRQLADIVGSKEENENEDGSVSEKAEAETGQDNLEDTVSSIGDEFEEDIITDEIRAIMERSEREDDLEEHHETLHTFEEDLEAKLREEEARLKEEEERLRQEEERLREEEARRQEEEKLAKKQKAMEEHQRPIILPGGRKWTNPEDAVPIFRKPKMSEEKIIETIESNLEPIIGNRKGINFLKYQPPLKSLDYLQRSEVYKLVHDMEPPARGITSRPEKIPAMQDYYEALKYSP